MNTPTVLDSKGQVLEVGSRVKHVRRGEGVVSSITRSPAPLYIRIRRDFGHSIWVKARPKPGTGDVHCPDLTLTSKRKESAPR